VVSALALAVVVYGLARGERVVTRPCPTCPWRVSPAHVQGIGFAIGYGLVLLLEAGAMIVYVRYYQSMRRSGRSRAETLVRLEESADKIFNGRSGSMT
jgi:hypothetical protein